MKGDISNDNDAIPMAVATVIPLPVDPSSVSAYESDARPTETLLNRSKRVLVPQSSSKQLNSSVIAALKDQGYTAGLIKSIARSNMTFPLRIWVVDNSGSMMTGDGHRIVETASSTNVQFVGCTRWTEIKETVEYHARLAGLLEAPTVFRLLNDPGGVVGPMQFSVAERGSELIANDLEIALETIQRVSPSGVTPLSLHVREIRENIIAMRDELFEMGQKVVVVLATDGLPSDNYGISGSPQLKEFQDALRSLEGLPVWIVVRLCTDEDKVVDFYNELDSQVELSVEVLDDFMGEAKEIYEHNKWLNYSLPLHRVREVGFSHKLFDLLDERPLTKFELREFFVLIFGEEAFNGVPDPQIDWKGFLNSFSAMNNAEKQQWNPIKRRIAPWVNIKKLDRAYGDSALNTMLRTIGLSVP